jgi:hypothetical protein
MAKTKDIVRKFAVCACAFGSGIGLFSCAPAKSAARYNAVYCMHNLDGLKVFAGRIQPGGNLSFGISIWSRDGNNIGVFGVASHHGANWEYTNKMNASTAADRCKLDIVLQSDGTPHLTADPTATCQSMGGHDTEIGSVQFPPSAYEGPVSTELNDPETFFGKAGKCWRK